jgi:hypothetical protein
VPFKILLLLDIAPGHPSSITDVDDNMSVMFLPPNTSLIEPMDQGVIANFKSYYLHKTFSQLVNGTDGKDQISVKECWKNFNIKNAIDNIAYEWAEVTQSCMKGVWKKIWPELSCSSDFNPKNELSNSRRHC